MTVKPPESWPWPPELDAMTAAPAYHDLHSENEHVRVLEAYVGPGETVPVHTHCWPGVLYILGVSDFVRRDPEGKVLVDTRADAPGPARVMCLGRSPQSTFAGERGRGGASQHHVRTQAGALHVAPCGGCQSPVEGSMTVDTSDTESAGNPPQRACSKMMSIGRPRSSAVAAFGAL